MTGGGGAPWSLSRRLAWRLAAVLLAGVLLAGAAMAWRTLTVVRDMDDAALQTQAAIVAQHLVAGPRGLPRLTLPPAIAAAFRSGDGDLGYLVVDRANRLLAASDMALARSILAYLPRPGRAGFFRVPASPDARHGLVGLLTDAGPFRVAVTQGHKLRDVLVNSLVHDFLESAVWLLLPIGLLAVGVGVVTLRRGLAPLRAASAAAALVDPSRAGVRLPDHGLPVELRPLVERVNAALDRLEDGIAAQRRFVGDAAHALRTPLAVLTARLDTLSGLPQAEALRADVDRMTRLVAQMLGIARLDGVPLDVSAPVDLRAVAVEAISALAPLAIRQGVELALAEPARPAAGLRGNHPALILALTNLIENALAHAPGGSVVEVRAGAACLAVLDRGPGVPPAERDGIFRRFQRGQGDRPGGAGLGLAIVAGIAARHGGSVCVEGRPGGGAAFVLRLRADTPNATGVSASASPAADAGCDRRERPSPAGSRACIDPPPESLSGGRVT